MFSSCGLQRPSTRDQFSNDAIRQFLESIYNQNLSEIEKEKIENYKSYTNIFVDELLAHNSDDYFEADLNRAVYEMYLVLRLFGLHEKFTSDEKSIIIRAFYEKIPKNIKVGTPIRNVIIPSYFLNKDPLIFHVTFAYSGNRYPTIVILTNTKGNIRSSGYEAVKNNGIGFQYPRITTINDRMVIQSDNNYSVAILSNGIISASSAVGKELPLINENENTLEMLNLTDDYLRDGILENDDSVLPIINKTIADNTKEPMERLFANMQLYIYYLFKNDMNNVTRIITVINESGLLEDETIRDTEIADIARNDMKNIVEIINIMSLPAASGGVLNPKAE
jgi:hypothetical protein